VGLAVKRATGGSQQPWVASSPIDGDFYFSGAPGNAVAAAPPASTPDACSPAQAHWESANAIGTVAAYQDHLRLFSKCAFAGLARARIDEKTKVAAISPPPAASQTRLAAGLDPANTIVIDTTKGRIVIKLRPDLAPKHAERIKQLAREGYYNNVPFHRVIDGFMARTSDPNSANSQFFIMFADGSALNGQYTVIGEVVSGMDVVDKLKRGQPVTGPDKMVRVQVASDIK
jgi:peptidylprolyl isomerase